MCSSDLHTELVKAEELKDGDQPDALLGAYAAKLAASRKKLKKVSDTTGCVPPTVLYVPVTVR